MTELLWCDLTNVLVPCIMHHGSYSTHHVHAAGRVGVTLKIKRPDGDEQALATINRKGTNGVNTHGVTATTSFPKNARAYSFSNPANTLLLQRPH